MIKIKLMNKITKFIKTKKIKIMKKNLFRKKMNSRKQIFLQNNKNLKFLNK
jgi:hypothetical protein